jgi:hypothetical protein
VFYVDTEDAFSGHRLCETNSFDVAVNGLTYGNGGPINGVGPVAKESYHPNALGNQAFARRISVSTNKLSAVMPVPSGRTALIELEDKDIPLLQNVPHENIQIKNLQYEDLLSSDVVYINNPLVIRNSPDVLLQPGSSTTVTLHSTPVTLGTVLVGTDGLIDSEFTMPADIPPGYHTIYVDGKNLVGEDITLTKIIYVAASSDDMDGNGVIDSQQACIGITPSGVDVDKDGIDDACDGFIDQAPPEPDPTPQPEAPPTDQNPQQPADNPQDQSDAIPPEKLYDIPPTQQKNNVIVISESTVPSQTNQPSIQTVNTVSSSSNEPSTPQQSPNNLTNPEITKVEGITNSPSPTNGHTVQSSRVWHYWYFGMGFLLLIGLVSLTAFRFRS